MSVAFSGDRRDSSNLSDFYNNCNSQEVSSEMLSRFWLSWQGITEVSRHTVQVVADGRHQHDAISKVCGSDLFNAACDP